MPVGDPMLGFQARAYTQSVGGSSWEEILHVREVTLNVESDETDVTARSGGGWRQHHPGLHDATIEMTISARKGDDMVETLREAWQSRTAREFQIMDGPNDDADSWGLEGTFNVLSFAREEPIDDQQNYSITLRPAVASVAPQWVSGTGGA